MRAFESSQPNQNVPLYSIGKKNSKIISWIFTFAILLLNLGCSYFKVQEVPVANNEDIANKLNEFNNQSKYMVLHRGIDLFHLQDPVIDGDNFTIKGNITAVGSNHIYKKVPTIGKSGKYNPKTQNPLNEVHLYFSNDVDLNIGTNDEINLAKLESVGIVDKNTGRSVANVFLGVLGAFAVIAIIIAATKSSCPFIYSYDGQDYVFSGELYPGNIIKNAQSPDYLRLSGIKNSDGFYKIKISNELLEVEHTDQILLWVIDHNKSTEVLLDPMGKPVYFENLVSPYAINEDGYNADISIIENLDNRYFSFNSNNTNSKNTRELTLKFKRHSNAKNASLKLSAKNSLWLDMLFGKMNEKFGAYYPTFQKNQLDLTKDKAEEWKNNQSIPLSVSVLENGVWKKISDIPSAGPIAFRDIGLSVNLENIKSDTVEIKLETGFMFWELDYAAMSFDANSEAIIHKIAPSLAITNIGKDVTNSLLKADNEYHIQDEIGQSVEVSFKAPKQNPDLERSFFVQSQGYYTYIRDYEGIPNFTELVQFRKPGYFPRFSEMQYNETVVPFINAENQMTLK
ncbi:hypothetical protein [Aegicerativicinus sediminis]|uniref:hypothetical protein n=1 Tax=Aegicerativicinus sediminis TaxID=2893202 RepID=UPI001E33EFCD|nr:hypothetical protein [Aegicerativicinus sediminis]